MYIVFVYILETKFKCIDSIKYKQMLNSKNSKINQQSESNHFMNMGDES